MSYNIDSWEQIGGGKLWITKRKAAKLRKKIADWCPSEFLDGLEFGDDGRAAVRMGDLRCEGSGNFYHEYIDDIASALEGEADFVLTWESGDCHSGLRIKDGEAIELGVKMTLVEPTK